MYQKLNQKWHNQSLVLIVPNVKTIAVCAFFVAVDIVRRQKRHNRLLYVMPLLLIFNYQNIMSIEYLLKKRYELIADYPACFFTIGTIFTEFENGYQGIMDDGKSTIVFNLDKMPHIFRQLRWHEKRERKDMPKFLKINDEEIVKIEDWIYQGTNFFGITNFAEKEGYDMFYSEFYNYLPATEEEYLSFISKA